MSLFLFLVHYQDVHTLNYLVSLKNSMKRLINILNNDNKCFLWCHIRHLNPLKRHHERIKKADKNWLMILIIKVLNFLFQKKIIARLNKKIVFGSMCFVMKIN